MKLIQRNGPLPAMMDARFEPAQLLSQARGRTKTYLLIARLLADLDTDLSNQFRARATVQKFNATNLFLIVEQINADHIEAYREDGDRKILRGIYRVVEIPVLGFHVVLKMPDSYNPATAAGKCLREFQRGERELVIGAGTQLFRLLQSRTRGNGIELNGDDLVEMSIEIGAPNCLLVCGTVRCEIWKLCEFHLGAD